MTKFIFHLLYACLLAASFSLIGCSKDDGNTKPDPDPVDAEFATGYFGTDNIKEVPVTTDFGFKGGTLPAKADITDKFPPIGDQGNYGTCVAWAVGYNMKTVIAGIKNNLSTSQLADTRHQYSPKYLFTALPDNVKGADCNGTNFDAALEALQSRGITTMQSVPYTNLGSCSQATLQDSWNSEASQYRIKYWRRVQGNVQSIKENISNNIPVVFGAELGDNFMSWRGDGVISSATVKDPNAMHGRHAMIIAGYDDNKGPNGAFKVVNSWNTTWGNQGTIWIDYNYFMNDFVTKDGSNNYALYIAEDGGGKDTPPDPDPNPVHTGVDLAPWIFADYSTYPNSDYYNERQVNFNIYNIGAATASSSNNWSCYYIYYNAYNADDYGVIFYDDFNTNIPANTVECPTAQNCVLNFNIPGGNNLANVAFNDQSIVQTYYMPQITGAYYLALIVDIGDRFNEQDEMNNIFYSTLEPKYFEYGYSDLQAGKNNGNYFKFMNTLNPTDNNLKKSAFNSAVTSKARNTYTPAEIKAFFAKEKASGRLQAKAKTVARVKKNANSK